MNCHHRSYLAQYEKQYEENEQKKSAGRKDSSEGMKQATLSFDKSKNLALNVRKDPMKQKRWDRGVVKFAAKTYTSFKSTEKLDILVDALFPHGNSGIKVKSNQTVSRHTVKIATEIQRDLLSIIMSAAETCSSFSFTTDLWSNSNNDSFMCLSIHFVTQDGQLHTFVPFIEYMSNLRHTGKNIQWLLEEMFNALGLSSDKISKYVTCDNASNNRLAVKLTSAFTVNWCVIHTCQLAIKVNNLINFILRLNNWSKYKSYLFY